MHKILYVYYITGLLLKRSDWCEDTKYTLTQIQWCDTAHRLTSRKIATQMLIDFFVLSI